MGLPGALSAVLPLTRDPVRNKPNFGVQLRIQSLTCGLVGKSFPGSDNGAGVPSATLKLWTFCWKYMKIECLSGSNHHRPSFEFELRG